MMAPTWAIRDASGPSAPDSPEAPAEPKAGRLPAFAEVHARYFDLVWSTARRFGVGSDAMDDVVQNVFIAIHSKLHTVERAESLRSWIYGVTRRTVLRYFRTRRSAAASEMNLAWLEEARAPLQPTPQELSERADRLRLLASLLDELSEPKREIFILADIEELTPLEIAEALAIPLNTVYSRLRAARMQFDEALRRRSAREAGGRQP
jgi:RNA polymerase sigma-70 factor (ECF subfamily)